MLDSLCKESHEYYENAKNFSKWFANMNILDIPFDLLQIYVRIILLCWEVPMNKAL